MTVYGLQWTQATCAYVRPAGTALTHLAVTSPSNAETVAAVAQASTYAPWSGIRRCNLWDDGTPTAYYGDRCYTDTDVANMGQAMVQIPKFWYTTDHGSGVYKWYISDTGADTLPTGADHDWAVHPAFIRNGVTKNYIYLGAYEAYLNGTKLESKAGIQPTGSQDHNQLRTAAQLRAGTTDVWEMQDYLATAAVQLLYLIEYGSFFSQTVLSAGITNITDDEAHTMASNTGHTSTLGNASGQVLHTFDHVPDAGDLTGYAMSYRGIENIYGNSNTAIDGITWDNPSPHTSGYVYIADHDFVSGNMMSPYTDTGLTYTVNSNYIEDWSVNGTYDYIFLPSSTNDVPEVIGDKFYIWGGTKQANFGGLWSSSVATGMFYFWFYKGETDDGRDNGTRLMYIG